MEGRIPLSWLFSDGKNLMLFDLERALALESDKAGPFLPLSLRPIQSLYLQNGDSIAPIAEFLRVASRSAVCTEESIFTCTNSICGNLGTAIKETVAQVTDIIKKTKYAKIQISQGIRATGHL